MNQAQTVEQGAAANRRRSPASPLELMARLRQQHPTASFEDIAERWRKLVERSNVLSGAVLDYAAHNFWNQLDRDECSKRRAQGMHRRYIERTAGFAESAAKLTAQIVAVVMMDLVLPSGKRLRDATFAECAQAGGWFLKVAKLGKATEIVGEKLTEAQLQGVA